MMSWLEEELPQCKRQRITFDDFQVLCAKVYNRDDAKAKRGLRKGGGPGEGGTAGEGEGEGADPDAPRPSTAPVPAAVAGAVVVVE